jgi:hypothetical protein
MKPGFCSFALHLLLLSFLTVLITAPLTYASIYNFTATSQDASVSDFTLQYDD